MASWYSLKKDKKEREREKTMKNGMSENKEWYNKRKNQRESRSFAAFRRFHFTVIAFLVYLHFVYYRADVANAL